MSEPSLRDHGRALGHRFAARLPGSRKKTKRIIRQDRPRGKVGELTTLSVCLEVFRVISNVRLANGLGAILLALVLGCARAPEAPPTAVSAAKPAATSASAAAPTTAPAAAATVPAAAA